MATIFEFEPMPMAETQEPKPVSVAQEEDAIIVPYVESSPLFPEEMLAGIYKRTKEEGLLVWAFGGVEPSLSYFLTAVGTTNHAPVMGYSNYYQKLAGYGWLFEWEGPEGFRKASLGFVFFKEFHHSKLIRDLARKAVQHWFKTFGLCVLYGATRSDNKTAIRFASRLGFKLVGRAPRWFCHEGASDDALVFCILREEAGLESGE